jgi:hypothetical protein
VCCCIELGVGGGCWFVSRRDFNVNM